MHYAVRRCAHLFGSSSVNMEGRMARHRLKYLMCFSLKTDCDCSILGSACCRVRLYVGLCKNHTMLLHCMQYYVL